MPLEAHRFASIFPPLDDDAFRELVEDMRVNGLREQITLFEGKILDGVNRYRACLQIGIDPMPKDYEGTDPLGFVISMNLQRRHLTEAQRAIHRSPTGDGRGKDCDDATRRPHGPFANWRKVARERGRNS